MQLALDLSTVRFAATGQSRPSLDFNTKMQRLDEEGRPIYEVRLFVIGAGDPEAIAVRVPGVPGVPKGLAEFVSVRVHGLTAATWRTWAHCRRDWRRMATWLRRTALDVAADHAVISADSAQFVTTPLDDAVAKAVLEPADAPLLAADLDDLARLSLAEMAGTTSAQLRMRRVRAGRRLSGFVTTKELEAAR